MFATIPQHRTSTGWTGSLLHAVGMAAAFQLACPASAASKDLSVGDDLITDTVASRTPREPETEGIHAGNFFIRPSVAALGIYDDNIFANDSNRQSDMRFELAPSVTVKSDLPRHVLDFSLDGRIVNYADHTEQNYENFQAKLRSALHFDHAHTLSFSALSALEHAEVGAITSGTTAAEPVPIFHNRVSAGVTRDAGRLYGTVSASAERWDYSDVTSTSGSIVDEDQRDLDQYSAQFRAGYRFSPGYEAVGKFRAIRQLGNTTGTDSIDATGYEALGGLAFETGPLLRWSLLAGYGYRDYDAESRSDVPSSLFEGELRWSPTQRMTLTGTIGRSFVDSLDEDGDARVETSVRGQITYDIWHNLKGHVELGLVDADFTGVDQQDTTWIARAGLDYEIKRDWFLALGYEHQDRNSTNDAFDMTRNRILVGAKLKF